MAQETKLLFDLSDIRSLRFVCQTEGCGAIQSFPLKNWQRIPRACSNDVTHDWIKGGSQEEKTLAELKSVLQTLLKYNGTSTFKVQLEFDNPENED
ncbi:MAG: hypothetical protein ACRD4S_01160 [Candidatus Acidiferrales bacterium]